jgi:hypothetical protein
VGLGSDLRINRDGKFEYKTMKDTSDMLNSESPRSWLIMGMNLLYKFNQNHEAFACFEKSLDLIKRPYIKEDFTIPKILIPAKNMQRIEWIIDQFTCIESETISLRSGQDYTRYFHDNEQPDDALHACIYAYVAWLVNKGTEWRWISA